MNEHCETQTGAQTFLVLIKLQIIKPYLTTSPDMQLLKRHNTASLGSRLI